MKEVKSLKQRFFIVDKSHYVIFVIFLSILFSITSCSLDRKNPLDPSGSGDVRVPPKVLGLTSSKVMTPQNAIIIRWNRLADVDGYYVYRAFGVYTMKEKIGVIESNDIIEYTDMNSIFFGRKYYYWISAYIEYPQGRLEGPLSDYIEVSF
ncbi:MAG: hypothetical protein K0B81_04315 [Candidatus Cloacimonetes bacterium]|nr:hypothetical protein [Candidatus Cloacimonadota bacterium]